MILALKSDSHALELILCNSTEQKDRIERNLSRSMAKDLPKMLTEFLARNSLSLSDINGIAVYAGPGSFTGLRITHAYANALAYALNIPITNESGDNWLLNAAKYLSKGNTKRVITPYYGGEANITAPKK